MNEGDKKPLLDKLIITGSSATWKDYWVQYNQLQDHARVLQILKINILPAELDRILAVVGKVDDNDNVEYQAKFMQFVEKLKIDNPKAVYGQTTQETRAKGFRNLKDKITEQFPQRKKTVADLSVQNPAEVLSPQQQLVEEFKTAVSGFLQKGLEMGLEEDAESILHDDEWVDFVFECELTETMLNDISSINTLDDKYRKIMNYGEALNRYLFEYAKNGDGAKWITDPGFLAPLRWMLAQRSTPELKSLYETLRQDMVLSRPINEKIEEVGKDRNPFNVYERDSWDDYWDLYKKEVAGKDETNVDVRILAHISVCQKMGIDWSRYGELITTADAIFNKDFFSHFGADKYRQNYKIGFKKEFDKAYLFNAGKEGKHDVEIELALNSGQFVSQFSSPRFMEIMRNFCLQNPEATRVLQSVETLSIYAKQIKELDIQDPIEKSQAIAQLLSQPQYLNALAKFETFRKVFYENLDEDARKVLSQQFEEAGFLQIGEDANNLLNIAFQMLPRYPVALKDIADKLNAEDPRRQMIQEIKEAFEKNILKPLNELIDVEQKFQDKKIDDRLRVLKIKLEAISNSTESERESLLQEMNELLKEFLGNKKAASNPTVKENVKVLTTLLRLLTSQEVSALTPRYSDTESNEEESFAEPEYDDSGEEIMLEVINTSSKKEEFKSIFTDAQISTLAVDYQNVRNAFAKGNNSLTLLLFANMYASMAKMVGPNNLGADDLVAELRNIIERAQLSEFDERMAAQLGEIFSDGEAAYMAVTLNICIGSLKNEGKFKAEQAINVKNDKALNIAATHAINSLNTKLVLSILEQEYRISPENSSPSKVKQLQHLYLAAINHYIKSEKSDPEINAAIVNSPLLDHEPNKFYLVINHVTGARKRAMAMFGNDLEMTMQQMFTVTMRNEWSSKNPFKAQGFLGAIATRFLNPKGRLRGFTIEQIAEYAKQHPEHAPKIIAAYQTQFIKNSPLLEKILNRDNSSFMTTLVKNADLLEEFCNSLSAKSVQWLVDSGNMGEIIEAYHGIHSDQRSERIDNALSRVLIKAKNAQPEIRRVVETRAERERAEKGEERRPKAGKAERVAALNVKWKENDYDSRVEEDNRREEALPAVKREVKIVPTEYQRTPEAQALYDAMKKEAKSQGKKYEAMKAKQENQKAQYREDDEGLSDKSIQQAKENLKKVPGRSAMRKTSAVEKAEALEKTLEEAGLLTAKKSAPRVKKTVRFAEENTTSLASDIENFKNLDLTQNDSDILDNSDKIETARKNLESMATEHGWNSESSEIDNKVSIVHDALDKITNKDLKALLKAKFDKGMENGLTKDIPSPEQAKKFVKDLNAALTTGLDYKKYDNVLKKQGKELPSMHALFNVEAKAFPENGFKRPLPMAPTLPKASDHTLKKG